MRCGVGAEPARRVAVQWAARAPDTVPSLPRGGAARTERDAHEHVLRPLDDAPVHPQEIRALERAEAEEVVFEVALVLDRIVQRRRVLRRERERLVRDEWRLLARVRIDVRVQRRNRLGERRLGLLVQVRDGEARGELAIVGVLRRHVRRRLARQVIELRRAHAVVHAGNYLLRDQADVDVRAIEAVAELVDARGDLVEAHGLVRPIALDHVHVGG